jgi:hypothetical protein
MKAIGFEGFTNDEVDAICTLFEPISPMHFFVKALREEREGRITTLTSERTALKIELKNLYTSDTNPEEQSEKEDEILQAIIQIQKELKPLIFGLKYFQL